MKATERAVVIQLMIEHQYWVQLEDGKRICSGPECNFVYATSGPPTPLQVMEHQVSMMEKAGLVFNHDVERLERIEKGLEDIHEELKDDTGNKYYQHLPAGEWVHIFNDVLGKESK